MKIVNEFAGTEIISASDIHEVDEASLKTAGVESLARAISGKQKQFGEEFERYERYLLLESIDELWMRHIDDMAHLREEVAFEGYAQKNPLVVYQERSYEKFMRLIDELAFRVTKGLLAVGIPKVEELKEIPLEILSVSGDNTPVAPVESGVSNLLSNQAYDDLAKHSGNGVRVYKKK